MGTGDSISANITGDVSGQVAVGKHIAQHQTVAAADLGADELAQLRQAFADLRASVAAQAPPERRAAAVERVEELEQACFADEPDMTTIAYVGRWFQTNLPALAGEDGAPASYTTPRDTIRRHLLRNSTCDQQHREFRTVEKI